MSKPAIEKVNVIGAIEYPPDYVFYYVKPQRHPVSWQLYLVVKRLMDISIGLLGLIALSPLIIMIAIAIWAESGWPVLFTQERAGRYGKLIRVRKFRTMHKSAPKYSLKMSADDPRITRIGRFLRRSSLDELPQLINILKGEMSLIGPRPEQPWIVEQLYRPWQFRRLSVTPGLSGWWQVNGRSDKPMHEHTDLDLYYIDNQSLWLDLKILAKTVVVVLNGKGAR